MSFENDITGIKNIFEAKPMFRPAGDAELHNREQHQAEQQTAQFAARKLEVGPAIHYIVGMVPGIRALEIKLQDAPIGNHGERDRNDFPEKVSFNIKIYKINIPEWAREKYDSLGMESRVNDHITQDMQDQLQSFGDSLQEEYSFITDWYQGGRMGGWLVLDIKTIEDIHRTADAAQFLDDFSDETDAIDITWEWNLPEFENTEKVLKEYAEDIRKRLEDLGVIAKKVERARQDVEKMFSSDEYWNDFFDWAEREAEESI